MVASANAPSMSDVPSSQQNPTSTTTPAPANANGDAERIFTCPICSRQFNKKANLKVHSRKHTGEKPYACTKPGCGRSFMWKSSVTFHEQNCQGGKKDEPSVLPTLTVSKRVQKRPKVSKSSRNTALMNTARVVTKSPIKGSKPKSLSSPKTQILQPNVLVSKSEGVLVDYAAQPLTAPPLVELNSVLKTSSEVTQEPSCAKAGNQGQVTDTSEVTPSLSSPSIAFSRPMALCLETSSALSIVPSAPSGSFDFSAEGFPSSAALVLNASQNSNSVPGLPEGAQLPAPSSILLDKRAQPGGGRPPVIPGTPKHFFSLQGSLKEGNGGGSKSTFDLRVSPSTPGTSNAKPPVMCSSKMPKMPISMDLDESDDEGTYRDSGIQEAFFRTGNFFGGFAPRCSPLPVFSPLVGPGISPMPLSPLAPFSPLPPDSPAHNAPNPVHPPVHQQPVVRPINSSW